MRSLPTANDDQPGPMGRRHSWTGGVEAQSVASRTPRTTPLRSDPRKPDHATVVFTAGAVDGIVAGLSRAEPRGMSPALTAGRSSGVFMTADADVGAAGFSRPESSGLSSVFAGTGTSEVAGAAGAESGEIGSM